MSRRGILMLADIWGSSREENLGGAEGSRTPDLYNAIVALSQLSYGPMGNTGRRRARGAVRPL